MRESDFEFLYKPNWLGHFICVDMDTRLLQNVRWWNILMHVLDTVNHLVVNILVAIGDDVACLLGNMLTPVRDYIDAIKYLAVEYFLT
jgi:hypothetical protein